MLRSVLPSAVAACGSVDAPVTDAGSRDGSGGDSASPDAALTHNAMWRASDGRPETACAPWELVENAEDPALVDGKLGLATNEDAENMYYWHTADRLVVPTTFVMEARMRFVAGASPNTARAGAVFGFIVGGRGNIIGFEPGAVFMLASAGTRGPSSAVPTDDGFHLYRVEMEASGAITVSRDGIALFTGSGFAWPDPDHVFFGDSSSVAHGVSDWEYVSHNAHVLGPCP